MFDDELHGAGVRDDLLHLTEVDEKGTVATDNHGIGMQVVLHLLGGGAEHVRAHLAVVQLINFHIVADCLYI